MWKQQKWLLGDILQIFYIVCARSLESEKSAYFSELSKKKFPNSKYSSKNLTFESINRYSQCSIRTVLESRDEKYRKIWHFQKKNPRKSLKSHVLGLFYLLNMHYGNWDKTSDFRSRFANWQVICSASNPREFFLLPNVRLRFCADWFCFGLFAMFKLLFIF